MSVLILVRQTSPRFLMIFVTGMFQTAEIHHGGVLPRQGAHRVVLALLFLPKFADEIRDRVGFFHVLTVQQRLPRAVNQLHEMCPVRDLMQH